MAAAVVAASGSIALMPRYTTDLGDHGSLILKPLIQPELGRYIDCLTRPETRERAGVQEVLGELRRVAAELTRTASR